MTIRFFPFGNPDGTPCDYWNPAFTINKHFLTCDEKCRIKGEISSQGNPAGAQPRCSDTWFQAFGFLDKYFRFSERILQFLAAVSLLLLFQGSCPEVSFHSIRAKPAEVFCGISL